jgi:hypothetical protein
MRRADSLKQSQRNVTHRWTGQNRPHEKIPVADHTKIDFLGSFWLVAKPQSEAGD